MESILENGISLFGDINLKPRLVTKHQINSPKLEVVSCKGLHFIHLKINIPCLK